MATTTIRKELKIYRGTYAEIMDPLTLTEDMAFYLAWNTGELFVGNALGVKVPYTGGESLTSNQVLQLIEDQTLADLTEIKAFLTLNNINYNNAMAALSTIDDYDTTLSATVTSEMSTILATWEDTTLGDNYYNKTEVDGINTSTLSTITTLRDNVYSKLVIDGMVSTALEDTISNDDLTSHLATYVDPYLTIQIIDDGNGYTETNIESLVETLDNGVYRIESDTKGYIIINKFGDNISRIDADGIPQSFIDISETATPDMQWVNYLNPLVVTSINSQTPVNGAVSLDASHIPGAGNTYWNNLYPQTIAGNYDNAINPLNRGIVGDNSIAFGYLSQAEAAYSIAIGSGALVDGLNSIQLGAGSISNPNIFKVWGHEILDNTTGLIPTERITERFNELVLTISISDWNITTTFIATITDMTADALVWVSPSPSNYSEYGELGIRATEQATNSLTFECDEIPTSDILVNLVWRV